MFRSHQNSSALMLHYFISRARGCSFIINHFWLKKSAWDRWNMYAVSSLEEPKWTRISVSSWVKFRWQIWSAASSAMSSGFKGHEMSWFNWPLLKLALITPTHAHPSLFSAVPKAHLAPGSPNCQKRFCHTYLWRLGQLHLRCTWLMKIKPNIL